MTMRCPEECVKQWRPKQGKLGWQKQKEKRKRKGKGINEKKRIRERRNKRKGRKSQKMRGQWR